MDRNQDLISDEHPRYLWRLLAAVLAFLYLGAMFIMSRSDLHAVFEPPLLLPIMNTIFAGLIPITVSIIAARTYLFSGLNSLLLMGCGMMTFGCGAVLAGWLISGQQGPNVNVTIYNSAALLGSVFHAVGAILTLKKTPETMPERRNFNLILAYSGMILLVFFLTMATLQGITPPFFIQGVGPTLLRQSVLGTAVILFLLSALVMMRIFTQRKLDFHYWYSLSLLMIALGLFAFFLQRSVGSPIGWLGRTGQYIGGIFALIAVLITLKSARMKGVSMPSAVTDIFRDAELSYRVLVETITDAIVSFQQDGKIIQWNTAAEKVFGYRQSEAVGSSLFGLVIGEAFIEMFRKEVNSLKTIDDQIKVGRPMEITGKTKDGAIIPIEVSTSAMQGRDQWSYVCVFRDISERKMAEAAIRKLNDDLEHRVIERTSQYEETNRELMSEIVDRKRAEEQIKQISRFPSENPNPVMRISVTGVLEYANDASKDILPVMGFEVGRQVNAEWQAQVNETLANGHPTNIEFHVGDRTFSATLGPVVDRGYVNLYATDITDRKRVEAERFKIEGQLHQSQKMEAIGTLSGGIAHDFNNILSAIIGYTEMAVDEGQKEIRMRYLQETLKGAERAKNLVRQILTFSRQDGHEKKPLDIKILLKEAIQFLRATIPATIEICQQSTDELCNIMADATQMHQVIMNLCTNAAYAMKQAGGVLTIELSAIELSQAEISRHHDLKPGSYVKLTVSDTGNGIDPALQCRIFDPFFTTKSKEEGTGLGLSVVYGIVKSHDGVITVYSELGKGTSFSVYLPRIIHEEVTIGSISGTVTGGTEEILFVDDEPALVDIGILMLSSLGYKVTGVKSSSEALDLFCAEPHRFDLVITDMTLPKMTGIDLSREILKIRPDMPIILCSGLRDPEAEEQSKSLGIRVYCTKPLTRKDLSLVIRETLDGDSI